jgi:hypothetical protein
VHVLDEPRALANTSPDSTDLLDQEIEALSEMEAPVVAAPASFGQRGK